MQPQVRELYEDLIIIQDLSEKIKSPKAANALYKLEWLIASTIEAIESQPEVKV